MQVKPKLYNVCLSSVTLRIELWTIGLRIFIWWRLALCDHLDYGLDGGNVGFLGTLLQKFNKKYIKQLKKNR